MVLLPTDRMDSLFSPRCAWVNGSIIVGAGPSGLAVAAILREQGVPFDVLERADCVASLWQKRTYDRLKLHLPKQFCELPRMPFPEHYPEYPTRRQFIDYLESYAAKFYIKPEFNFNHTVLSARYNVISCCAAPSTSTKQVHLRARRAAHAASPALARRQDHGPPRLVRPRQPRQARPPASGRRSGRAQQHPRPHPGARHRRSRQYQG